MSDTNPTLIAALKYLKLGLSVIPCHPRTKIPALSSWEPFQKRLPTESEIRQWFGSGNLNLGIVTGALSNLAVIDMDGSHGISAGREMSLYSPVSVWSGNGKHLWHQYSEGVVNSASKIAEGVDIRGEGGFIMAPPSIHENGKFYRFASSVSPQMRSPFPTAILTVGSAAVGTVKPVVKEASWIDEALEDFKNGHVSNTLVSILGKFRAHNFSEETTFKFLQPHNTSGRLDAEELRSKITEIWGRYEPNAVKVQVNASESKSVEVFLADEIKTAWLCKPFFSALSLGFIVGLPESLKSWLAIDLAIELSRGGKWLGMFPTNKSRVLYLDQERAKPETQRRFNALLTEKGMEKDTLSNQLFIDCSSHRKMDLDSSYEAFRKEVSRIRPDVIIVDSFVTFHTKPENDRMEIQKVLDRLKSLREDFNCTTLFINHESKSAYHDAIEHLEPSAGRMVGSIGVVAAAESILSIKKIDHQSSSVYQTKNSLASPGPDFMVRVTDTSTGIKVEASR